METSKKGKTSCKNSNHKPFLILSGLDKFFNISF
jgi:hypothetical protein